MKSYSPCQASPSPCEDSLSVSLLLPSQWGQRVSLAWQGWCLAAGLGWCLPPPPWGFRTAPAGALGPALPWFSKPSLTCWGRLDRSPGGRGHCWHHRAGCWWPQALLRDPEWEPRTSLTALEGSSSWQGAPRPWHEATVTLILTHGKIYQPYMRNYKPQEFK